jgi:hypothetical protein
MRRSPAGIAFADGDISTAAPAVREVDQRLKAGHTHGMDADLNPVLRCYVSRKSAPVADAA